MYKHLRQLTEFRHYHNHEFPQMTWEKLRFAWLQLPHSGKCLTEQEAVGLLYAGTNIPVPDAEESVCLKGTSIALQELYEERVGFYLGAARYKNQTVARTAQQLIVKRWLRIPTPLAYPECLQTHIDLLEFLQKPLLAISHPPYPRFVTDYLMSVDAGLHDGADLKVRRKIWSLRINAMLSWGIGDRLGDYYATCPEVIPYIEDFLKGRSFEDFRFVYLANARECIADLAPVRSDGNPDSSARENVERQITNRAGLALMKLRFLHPDASEQDTEKETA